MDPILQDVSGRIQSTLDHLKSELASIRAGRANPQLIENIPVDVYGSRMKLMEVGTISAPQPLLLSVQVWDASIIQDVIKAINEANLGLNPSHTGTTIRLPIPPLTEERRGEFIKLARSKMEDARISIRQIRQDLKTVWETQMEEGQFGEDEINRRMKLLQRLVDHSSDTIDQIGKGKEEELSQI